MYQGMTAFIEAFGFRYLVVSTVMFGSKAKDLHAIRLPLMPRPSWQPCTVQVVLMLLLQTTAMSYFLELRLSLESEWFSLWYLPTPNLANLRSWHISTDGEFVSVFQRTSQSTSTDALIFFGLLMGNDFDDGVSFQPSRNSNYYHLQRVAGWSPRLWTWIS